MRAVYGVEGGLMKKENGMHCMTRECFVHVTKAVEVEVKM
jgi:hypothetical protein